MDADEIFRRADFSRETDFKERLWFRLAAKQSPRPAVGLSCEGEICDEFMAEVAAAGASPLPPKKPQERPE